MRIDLPRGLVVLAIVGVTLWLIRDQEELSEAEPEAEAVIEAPSQRFGLALPETKNVPLERPPQAYEDWSAGIAYPPTASPLPQATPETYPGYDIPQPDRIGDFRFRPLERTEPASGAAGQPYFGSPNQRVPHTEGYRQQEGVPGYRGQPAKQYHPSGGQETRPRRRWTGNYGSSPQGYTGTPEPSRNQTPYLSPYAPTDKGWGQPLLDYTNPYISPGQRNRYSVR